MNSSGAAYVNDQLGNGWIFSAQGLPHLGRFGPALGSKQSIFSLLGQDHIAGNENYVTSNETFELISSLAAVQVSAEPIETPDHLRSLINENEIRQIRSDNEGVLRALLNIFVFEKNTRVRSFLEDHPSVSDLLLEAAPFLSQSFGDNAVLQLQIPPDEDIPVTIYAEALWEGTLEEARAALKNFDEAWWIANSRRASGRVVIDYQLV